MITTAALSPTRRGEVRELLAAVTAEDQVSPLDEAAILALDGGDVRHVLLEGPEGDPSAPALLGYASVLADGTVQGMVHPAHRRRGHGTAVLQEALALHPGAGVWAHGALDSSLAFLGAAGLEETRRLLTLRRDLGAEHPVPEVPAATLEGLRLDTFDPERDAERWVEVNARAFASHPEQGALTRDDLDQRLAQPWFDPEDMVVALQDGTLIGFVWVKRESPGAALDDAEIYVVATDPFVQGHGIAGLLLATSLSRLQEAGVPGVELYVEADNSPALRLYETWGFDVSGRDVQMRTPEKG